MTSVSPVQMQHQCQISRSAWKSEVPLNDPYLLALCTWTKPSSSKFPLKTFLHYHFLGYSSWSLVSLWLLCPAWVMEDTNSQLSWQFSTDFSVLALPDPLLWADGLFGTAGRAWAEGPEPHAVLAGKQGITSPHSAACRSSSLAVAYAGTGHHNTAHHLPWHIHQPCPPCKEGFILLLRPLPSPLGFVEQMYQTPKLRLQINLNTLWSVKRKPL